MDHKSDHPSDQAPINSTSKDTQHVGIALSINRIGEYLTVTKGR